MFPWRSVSVSVAWPCFSLPCFLSQPEGFPTVVGWLSVVLPSHRPSDRHASSSMVPKPGTECEPAQVNVLESGNSEAKPPFAVSPGEPCSRGAWLFWGRHGGEGAGRRAAVCLLLQGDCSRQGATVAACGLWLFLDSSGFFAVLAPRWCHDSGGSSCGDTFPVWLMASRSHRRQHTGPVCLGSPCGLRGPVWGMNHRTHLPPLTPAR